MQLKIVRQKSNRLYTEGRLIINDMKTCHTIEATANMLPVGRYLISLTSGRSRRRVIGIYPKEGAINHKPSSINLYSLGISQSWIVSKRDLTIGIGEPLIPGALYKCSIHYERLFDRIEKCEARGETIELLITDDGITLNRPLDYWTEPPSHHCPPSKYELIQNDDGSLTLFYGPTFIRHYPSPINHTPSLLA